MILHHTPVTQCHLRHHGYDMYSNEWEACRFQLRITAMSYQSMASSDADARKKGRNKKRTGV